MEYAFRTTPFRHQRELWDLHKNNLAWGYLLEMGCGKSKLVIDEATCLHQNDNKINGLFIVAPNGVHRNWISNEIPTHMPLETLEKAQLFSYSGDKHASGKHQMYLGACVNAPQNVLSVLAMSFDSLMTEHGRKAAKEFLTKRKCMFVVDESLAIKDMKAQRTKRVLAAGKYAPYRRILNGTPLTNGPFDIYSQILFLDPDFWTNRGISSFPAFKTMFASFKPIKVAGGRIIMTVDSYKNLPLLKSYVDELCSRVTKDEVLDLPPKLYSTRSFEMTKEQERVYNDLKTEFMTILQSEFERHLGDGQPIYDEDGLMIGATQAEDLVTADMALTRILRLQQVTCGYLPSDDTGKIIKIGDKNPRLELLEQICEEAPHSVIIWSRFRQSIDTICEMLKGRCVRYDGKVDEDERAIAIERFQAGDAQFFVGNAQAAGKGLTLHKARTVIYESNNFNLGDRLQSEDRAHRIGQEHPVQYIDLVAAGTIDEHIAQSLIKKMDVAQQVTGDKVKEWLK